MLDRRPVRLDAFYLLGYVCMHVGLCKSRYRLLSERTGLHTSLTTRRSDETAIVFHRDATREAFGLRSLFHRSSFVLYVTDGACCFVEAKFQGNRKFLDGLDGSFIKYFGIEQFSG